MKATLLHACTRPVSLFSLLAAFVCAPVVAHTLSPEVLIHADSGFNLPLWGAEETALDLNPATIQPWPNAIVELAPQIEHVLVADLQHHRLYLLAHQNGQLRLLRQMYASIGKKGIGKEVQGDNRTPVGVYQITRYIDDPQLPELYGSGAFPVDYPNAWDRKLNRTGYGIWLHGVPRNAYSRQPLSSEGCLSVSNEDLDSLKAFLKPGLSVVIFSDQLEWEPASTPKAESFKQSFERWKQAWKNLDTEAYLSHYAADFRSGRMNRAQFADYKRQVNKNKAFIELDISQRSIFRYPAADTLIMVDFTQDYRSDNFVGLSKKKQFWRLNPESKVWEIVLELNTSPGSDRR